ncbi:hypothetical protein Tco_0833249 [Tanacetum coccineum]
MSTQCLQAYLVATNAESKPFEDPVETEAPESPHTVAPPTSLHDSTSPTLVPVLRRIARMAVRVPPTMSLGLSAIGDDEEEDDDDEEDEEIEESSDSDSVSEDAEDEGPTAKDEDCCRGRGSCCGGRGPRYIDVLAYPPPTPPAQTPPSLEWSPGSLPISPAPSLVPSPISSPMISLTVPSPIASPTTAETEGFLTELGARVEVQGGLICDHTSWAGQTDAQRVALWHGISDTQRDNWKLRLQLAEERRARLDLAEIVDSMRRGQEPRGDV